MASDAQESGPLPGTGPSAKFTQALWITHFGHETGIFGDTDGSAFGITLPPSGDVAEIGSASIDSIAKVGGFPLRIPAGETQSLEIPPSLTGGTVGRTDLITARLNTGSFTTAPGPVRLHRIAGTEGSATRPSFDSTLPSPFDVTIWAITRKQGEALNQATVVDLRKRTGRHYLVPANASLPTNAPLGSTATRDGIRYRRDFDGATVDWVAEAWPTEVVSGVTAAVQDVASWTRLETCRMERTGKERKAHVVLHRDGTNLTSNSNGWIPGETVARLYDQDKPPANTNINFVGRARAGGRSYAASAMATGTGELILFALAPGITLSASDAGDTLTLDASWTVA